MGASFGFFRDFIVRVRAFLVIRCLCGFLVLWVCFEGRGGVNYYVFGHFWGGGNWEISREATVFGFTGRCLELPRSTERNQDPRPCGPYCRRT